jgi:tRNA-specific 2-thiouridylase
MLTPVGALTKTETRERARALGLVTADKPESVEICFVPTGDYLPVLERHLPEDAAALQPGPIRTTHGTVIGEHRGFARYTVGQRRGLPGGFADPLFVVAIDPEERAVIVGGADDLLGHRVTLDDVNWLVERPLTTGDACEVQVRYRAAAAPARVTETSTDGRRVTLTLTEPVRAIAPGQSGVLYHGDRVLGGGVIA